MHGVVRTDNMAATDVRGGENLVSARYQSASEKLAVDNGNVLLIGDLEAGEREIYKASAPAANSPLKDVVLVASSEDMYDEHLHNLDEFYNVEGSIVRGYHFHRNDTFGITADCFEAAAAVAVNDIVELQAKTKMKIVKTATSGSTKVGHVIAIEKAGRYEYVVVKVD